MKIVIIVSSNIVKDPRVVKQAEIVKSLTNDFLVIGKHDENITDERVKKLNFPVELIKVYNSDNILTKAINRLLFGYKLIILLNKYKPDVIHANDFDMLFFSYFIKRKNQNLIYDAHEIYSKNGLVNKYRFVSKAIELMEKKMLKKVDTFITVSNASKGYYLAKDYKEPIVITNTPIYKNIDPLPKAKKFQVLYHGIISENRGYEEFSLAAIENKTNDIEFILRGYGPLESKIKEIQAVNDIKNLILEEPVEMDEMIYTATRSHVGVVLTKPVSANYKYTISNKFFEYIHAGLPIIASPVPEHEYLLNKYNIGILLEEVTPNNIYKAVKYLYDNPEIYKEKKENVLKARELLRWQNEARILKDIYLYNSQM
ncbi:hypothetical protein BHM04_11845 [Macrococcus sp. IME1552]|nr:glycosyltransferase [Macrococcus sp. IME1552]ATD31834.1 hypothetical protein BHM04_11845 [Macrococcus sp. IME1552]